jgi:hypothetical protein
MFNLTERQDVQMGWILQIERYILLIDTWKDSMLGGRSFARSMSTKTT